MKSHARIALLLLSVAAPLSAQPYGYGPAPGGAYPGGPWGRGESAVPAQPPGAPAAGPQDSGMSRPAAPGLGPRVEGAQAEAVAVLKEGVDKLLGFLEGAQDSNNLQVAAFLDREIAPYFDFDYMAQWVAGPAYGGMTADERKALAAQLESDFLATLARNLVGYSGQQIQMLPPRRGPRGAVVVNVAVMQPGGYPTRLEFRMSKSQQGWKVYDVVANGQSAASFYRTDFRRTAQQRLGYIPR